MTSLKQRVIMALTSFTLLFGTLAVAAPVGAQAPDPSVPLQAIGGAAGIEGAEDDNAVFDIIGRIVNIVLGLLGVVFFAWVLWAGVTWMTANGDPGKVQKAQKMMIEAAIGIVIILSALAISNFVVGQLVTATAG